MLKEFTDQLRGFGQDVERVGAATFHAAAEATAEAVVIGNQFGPGAPLDTGFLRASFRVSRNRPEDGPSVAPVVTGRKDGDPPIYTTALDTSSIAAAGLGDEIFVSTVAEYADYLEAGGMVRRNGPPENRGASTQFVAPVEARWPAILDDAARRVGYGR